MRDVFNRFCSVFLSILVFNVVNAVEHCWAPDREPGVCAPFSSCGIKNRYQNGDVTRESQCNGDNNEPWVCCPTNQLPVPVSSVCGQTFAQFPSRIVGGSDTCIGEYPWMTVLLYEKSNKLIFGCGGSLITMKHVLTAAHCLIKYGRPFIPKFARLGDWNRTMSPDCQVYDGIQKCAAEEIDAEVANHYRHEQYSTTDRNRLFDIALLYLKTVVTFTEFVRPICILDAADEYEGNSATAIGYGKTDTEKISERLLSVELDVETLLTCKQKYKFQGQSIENSQICTYKKNANTCSGDSGSPLMRQIETNPPYWYQVGITSYGPVDCGKTDNPGVYTNVNSYIEWIKENIKK